MAKWESFGGHNSGGCGSSSQALSGCSALLAPPCVHRSWVLQTLLSWGFYGGFISSARQMKPRVCVRAQSCLTPCCSPGCSVRGLFQARILMRVAISSSRGSSQPRHRTLMFCVACISSRILYHSCHVGSPETLGHWWLSQLPACLTFPGASRVAPVVKNSPANTGDAGLIPELGRSPAVGSSNLLQYSCLGNFMDGGAWRATVAESNMIKHCSSPLPRGQGIGKFQLSSPILVFCWPAAMLKLSSLQSEAVH